MRRTAIVLLVLLVAGLFVATPARAQQQVLNFQIGGFLPRAEDGRPDQDTLVQNLRNAEPLDFQVKDFRGAALSGEWLFRVMDYVEVGAGLGYYQKSVPSVYRDVINSNGSEIQQDLKLRVIPFTAVVHFLPLGYGSAVEPYVGAGLGVFAYRYSETGEFVDTSDYSIYRANYAKSGTAIGPVIMGGVRVPFARFAVGGELRYQRAEGDLTTDFLGNKIDLTGVSFVAQFGVRF
jgi:outer membrane protein W